MLRHHLAVWATAPWLGTIVGTLAVATVIGGGAIAVALVGAGHMLLPALGVTALAGSWTTSRTIERRPAVASGAPTPSRRAPGSAAPRHRARRPATRGGAGRRAPKTSAAATLAPTTGRPPTGGSAAHQTPAAVVSPAPAAAGSTPARAMPVSPTRYAPGRATVGGAR